MFKKTCGMLIGLAIIVTGILVDPSIASATDERVGAGVKLVTPNNNLPWIVNMTPTPHYSSIPVRGPIQAGTTATWELEVKNAGNITSNFASYVASARSTGLGGVFDWVRNADGTPLAPTNEVTNWTTLTPVEQNNVAPGASYNVTATVSVPVDAANGKYYGVIWNCVKTTPTPGTIKMSACAGMRVYLEVTGGTGQPDAGVNPDVVAYRGSYFDYLSALTAFQTNPSDATAYSDYKAAQAAFQSAYKKAYDSIILLGY